MAEKVQVVLVLSRKIGGTEYDPGKVLADLTLAEGISGADIDKALQNHQARVIVSEQAQPSAEPASTVAGPDQSADETPAAPAKRRGRKKK